ncbi:hypothetical protein RZP48_21270, partial [Enterobacter asburiae]
HVRVGNCQASIRRTPYRKVRGFLLCARENMPDGGFALSGLQNSQARQADPTAKRNKNTKKGCINAEKQKPSHRLGSLNSGAGLGIDALLYSYDLQVKFLMWLKMYPHLYPLSHLLRI